MSILNILTWPDERLRRKAKPVAVVDDGVRAFAADLAETMYAARGVGLAATQVGDLRRIIAVDVSDTRDALEVLINPRILASDGVARGDEGCLSVPDVTEAVSRAARIRFAALDLDGNPVEREADGLLAVCVQHEVDHLDGVLFIDHLSPLKRQRLGKRAAKIEREARS